MKIKAKQVFFVGAFIVLTIVGYKMMPQDEVIIDLNSDEDVVNNDEFGTISQVSGTNKDIIYVHIEGAVNSPGIKEIPKGTRLFELIELAEGTVEDADLSKINLASILKDEQKIYVPYKVVQIIDESADSQSNKNINFSNNSSKENYFSIESTGSYSELVNINMATSEELQKLEGIGPSMAKKIIDYREENGYFSSIEELQNVSGIGEAKYNKIKENITI